MDATAKEQERARESWQDEGGSPGVIQSTDLRFLMMCTIYVCAI